VGALHPVAVPCLMVVWLVYAAFLASLGLWFSVLCRSAHRAILWTLVVMLGALFLLGFAAYQQRESWTHLPLEGYALVPPLTLDLLVFPPLHYDWACTFLLPALGVQLLIWSLAAAGLYVLAGQRFRVLVGRVYTAGWRLSANPRPPAAPSTFSKSPTGSPCAASPEEAEYLVSPATLRWPRCSRNTVLVLLPLALLAAWYAYLVDAADRELKEAIAEADRLDPEWRLEKLEAKGAAFPDEQNSVLHVLKTSKLIAPNWSYPAFDDSAPERQLSASAIRGVKEALAKGQPALAEARRLSELPNGRAPVVWKGDWFSANVSHDQQAREVAILLALDVALRAQEKDADGALASCRAMVNAGRSVGDFPTLLSQEVRIGIISFAIVRIERTLAQGEPSGTNLLLLERLLADEEQQPLLLFAMRGERAGRVRFFEALRAGKIHTSSRGNRSPTDARERWDLVDVILPLLSGSLKSEEAALLRSQTELIEIAKSSPEEQDAQFTKLKPLPQRYLLARRLQVPAKPRFELFRGHQAQIRAARQRWPWNGIAGSMAAGRPRSPNWCLTSLNRFRLIRLTANRCVIVSSLMAW
jgi:hypothetical protein